MKNARFTQMEAIELVDELSRLRGRIEWDYKNEFQQEFPAVSDLMVELDRLLLEDDSCPSLTVHSRLPSLL